MLKRKSRAILFCKMRFTVFFPLQKRKQMNGDLWTCKLSSVWDGLQLPAHTQSLACVGSLCHNRIQPAHYVLPVQLHTAFYYYKTAVLPALCPSPPHRNTCRNRENLNCQPCIVKMMLRGGPVVEGSRLWITIWFACKLYRGAGAGNSERSDCPDLKSS